MPPYEKVLILGKKAPHGKKGISKSYELLIPNGFEIIDTDYGNVDCIFINKRILAKMPKDRILKILETNVFPYISEKEIVKVDFKVQISTTIIEE